MFSVYKVQSYNLESKNFEKYKISFNSPEELKKELEENDFNYHFRINKGKRYIFFGDIDNFHQPIESLVIMLKSFLSSKYGLVFNDKDFRYTRNNTKVGSYHFSIPKWNLQLEKLKEVIVNFQNEYRTELGNVKAIDTTIYSDHWFRCPYQSKGNGDLAVHEVVEGDTEDFIIDFIPDYSIDIDEKIIIKNKNKINYIDSINANTNEIKNLELPKSLNNDNDLIQALLCCIKNYDDYETWLNVCFSIKKYPEMHQLVHQWAKQSKDKYNYNDTQKKIEEGSGDKGIGSLYYLAIKNKTEYNNIFEKLYELDTDFIKMLDVFNDTNISRYFYKYHKFNYLYNEIDEVWYVLNNNNIWESYNNVPSKLKLEITDFLTTRMEKYNKVLKNKLEETKRKEMVERYDTTKSKEELENNKQNVENINARIKVVNKNILNIGKTVFVKNIILTLSGFYTNKKITNILESQDDNRHKFAFENGYYDLKELKFKQIEPEDYILITTGYDYIEYPTKVEYVKNIIKDIATDVITDINYISDYQYLINMFSSALYGLNKRREIYIFTGTGSNGKSFIIDSLVKPAFGKYYKSISANYYTKESGKSNEATPEIADKRYCRILVSSEPEACQELQTAKIKLITGLEEIQARAMFKSGIEYKPQFIPFLLANEIPDFNKIDKASAERIKINPFLNKFINDTPVRANQKKKNVDLLDSLKTLEIYQSFIWLLIENYKNMNTTKISYNSYKHTTDFILSQNPLFDFIQEKINKTNNSKVRCGEVFDRYIEYCDNKNKKKLSQRKFSEMMKYNDFEVEVGTGNKSYYLDCELIN